MGDVRIIGSAVPTYVNLGADGNVVAAPGAGNRITVHAFSISNDGANDVDVFLREGNGGTGRFRFSLATKTSVTMNLVGCSWSLPVNTALYADLTGAALDVYITAVTT